MGFNKGERLKVKGESSVSPKGGLSAQRSNSVSGLTAHIVCGLLLLALTSCSISFKLNGANINYQTTHTISIADFPNNAPMVNPTLSNNLSEGIRDLFQRQTRLQILRKGGDLEIEGAIVGYDLSQGAISVDSYASESKLTIRVKVHFTNNVNPEDSFEKEYSAYQTFDASRMLNDVQDELCDIIIKEIAENIYNDTVAKW